MGTLLTSGLLALIAAQAEDADLTRSISPEVIAALKASPVMSMSASREIGGLESSIADIADELSALAAACSSTAWCM